jgi:CRISPR associated protein Cas1
MTSLPMCSIDVTCTGRGIVRPRTTPGAGSAPFALRAIGAALVQIGRDGEVLAHSVPFGYEGHPVRRAHALAVTNGLDLAIARELIAAKLDGQRQILVRLGADPREHDKLRAAIDAVDSMRSHQTGPTASRPRSEVARE